jgi:hypothetical protein
MRPEDPLGLGCHSIRVGERRSSPIFANEVVHIDGQAGADGGSAESLVADLASLRYFSIEN